MHRFMAFLRAINVGGRTVKMQRLREIFEALDVSNVATFIASGNVIFECVHADAGSLELRIEEQLQQALGYAVDTFVRSPAELEGIVHYRPFPGLRSEAGTPSLFVGFLREHPPPEAAGRVMELGSDTDEVHVHGREIYWQRRTSMSESGVSGALLERTLGMRSTLRNINTVKRLAARYPATEPAREDP